jgi:hypothetical protein
MKRNMLTEKVSKKITSSSISDDLSINSEKSYKTPDVICNRNICEIKENYLSRQDKGETYRFLNTELDPAEDKYFKYFQKFPEMVSKNGIDDQKEFFFSFDKSKNYFLNFNKQKDFEQEIDEKMKNTNSLVIKKEENEPTTKNSEINKKIEDQYNINHEKVVENKNKFFEDKKKIKNIKSEKIQKKITKKKIFYSKKKTPEKIQETIWDFSKKKEILKEEEISFKSEDDFDSGDDNSIKLESFENNDLKNLKFNFCCEKKKEKNQKNHSEEVFNLVSFIKQKFAIHPKKKRLYICNFCQKKFDEPSSLGGHTSKNHPNQSKEYKYRKLSFQNRAIERKRIDFYNNLE